MEDSSMKKQETYMDEEYKYGACRWCGKKLTKEQKEKNNNTCCEEHEKLQSIADGICNF